MRLGFMAFAACLLLPVSSAPLTQQLQEPVLVAAQLPRSAPEGEVRASFVLNTKGEVVSVEILPNGSLDFHTTTEENIRSWKFRMPRDLYRTEWRYETTFRYHSREVPDSEPEKLIVVFESFHNIDIKQNFHKNISSRIAG